MTRNEYENQYEYIETTIQPFDSDIGTQMPAEVEIEMAENIYDMRREFKRQNKQLRRHYSSKEPREKRFAKVARSHNMPNRQAMA